MTRGAIIRAPRAAQERLARYLHLRFEPSWSARHLGSLIFWRLTRSTRRAQGRTAY